MNILLGNEEIEAEISSMGGELVSLRDRISGKEYLWNGDALFWNRHSPILFPFVGRTRGNAYLAKGQRFKTSQHGFARDMEFELVEGNHDAEAWLVLRSNEETLEYYPYEFELYLGYRLEGRMLRVLWKVVNPSVETMYFSIGGHPGFFCPIEKNGKRSDYQICFDTPDQLIASIIGNQGLATNQKKIYPLQNGHLDIHEDLFKQDALVIENHQAHSVALLKKGEPPYVTIRFDAPLFGVWAPAFENVPFICIEPWYGRCDHEDFLGTLEEREWGNRLEGGGAWEVSYTVTI